MFKLFLLIFITFELVHLQQCCQTLFGTICGNGVHKFFIGYICFFISNIY